jgi:fatty acid-binding protein 3
MPITGKYQLTSSENFEEYMKAVGVGMVMRKLAATAKPVTEITQNNDEWNIKTTTTFKTTEIKFKLGEPFDEETADGRKCNSTIVLNDNTLVHTQKCGDKEYKILREFKDNEMKMLLEAEGVTSTRTYTKVEE